MLPYCLKCRENILRRQLKDVRTKNEKTLISLNSAVCNSKKLKFLKEQQASGLLDSLVKSLI